MISVSTLHGRRDFEEVPKVFDIKESPWYWANQSPDQGPQEAGYFFNVAPVAPERVAEEWSVKPEESSLS